MLSFKSGNSSGSISSLKLLLDVILDAKKIKAALDDLSERHDKAVDAEKEASNKLSQLKGLESSLASKEVELQNKSDDLIKKELEFKAKSQNIGARESKVNVDERSLEFKVNEFNDIHSGLLKDIAAQKANVDQKHSEAKDLHSEALEIKNKYEEKLHQIKSLAN